MWENQPNRAMVYDPVATCSGCRIVSDFLQGSYHYAMELKRHGQAYGHILLEGDDMCSSTFLSQFHLRKDLYGLSSFVHKPKHLKAGGDLGEICKQLYAGNKAGFLHLIRSGEQLENESLCASFCEQSSRLEFVDKVSYALRNQPLLFLPYVIIALLLVTMVISYVQTTLKRFKLKVN